MPHRPGGFREIEKSDMKKISSVWFALSVFVFPCVFNLERIGICVILLANIIVSFRWFKKHNHEYVL